MNDIPKTFGLVKLLMGVVTLVVTSGTIWLLYSIFESADRMRDSIFVVDSRNTLKLALAESVEINRAAEAEALVKRVHELLFVLSPDVEFINDHIEKVLYLSGNSVKNYCNSLKENGYYNSLVANGVSTEFMCDSVTVVADERYDYKAILYGKTSMVYSDKIVFKSLQTECYLYSCERDELDPQGFVVDDWRLVRYDDLGVVDRSPYEVRLAEDTVSVRQSADSVTY